MMSESWYEVVEAERPLTQGDLVFDCPLLTWNDTPRQATSGKPSELKEHVSGFQEDVIVMTQACDLEHGKVTNVVLCPHISLTDFRRAWEEWMSSRSQSPSEKAWKRACDDIVNGYVWNQSFLNRFDDPRLAMDVRVVEFHEVFTMPRGFLESLLRQRETPRLRLLPPYREHLSQAFARFFMRVGLPQPVTKSW